MPTRPLLVDTDVAAGIFKKKLPAPLATRIADFHPVLTFVGWAEIVTWANVREWDAGTCNLLGEWMADLSMLPGDEAVADTWAVLDGAAQMRGRPKSENITWVAACSLAYDLPLATLKVKDFEDFRIHHGLDIVTA